jgi:phage protein D
MKRLIDEALARDGTLNSVDAARMTEAKHDFRSAAHLGVKVTAARVSELDKDHNALARRMLEAVAHALDAAGREVFTPARREFTARRQAVIAANPDLQEREALKNLALIASMIDALKRRGVPDLTARVAAELDALASTIAYESWSQTTAGDDFSEIARQVLDDVQASMAFC